MTLRIMARINTAYLNDPCSGSRRMVGYLAREGIQISRHRVRNPDAPQRITCAVPQAAYHSPWCSIRALSLPGGSQPGQSCGSSVGQRYHLHPAPERLTLPGGDPGSPLEERSQLEVLQQPWQGILPGGAGDVAGGRPPARDLRFPIMGVSSPHPTTLPGYRPKRSKSAGQGGRVATKKPGGEAVAHGQPPS